MIEPRERDVLDAQPRQALLLNESPGDLGTHHLIRHSLHDEHRRSDWGGRVVLA